MLLQGVCACVRVWYCFAYEASVLHVAHYLQAELHPWRPQPRETVGEGREGGGAELSGGMSH